MNLQISKYHFSVTKRVLDILVSFFGLITTLPLILVFAFLIKLTSRGPVFFLQKRTGLKGKSFTPIKFRTMKPGAEKEESKLKHRNQADGPVFKIANDPRFTKLGKFLARSGLDEIPQLINVLKGDMSMVGPRPLRPFEINKLAKEYKSRLAIKPGITSSWVINGSHNMKFKKWMELDKEYIKNATSMTDITILYKTARLMLSIVLRGLIQFSLN
jgi:lipopolysaccharide/colanic/teichoic acid biosynthesis glycosyltransferase